MYQSNGVYNIVETGLSTCKDSYAYSSKRMVQSIKKTFIKLIIFVKVLIN